MYLRNFSLLFLTLVSVFIFSPRAWAIPSQVTISAYLEDAAGDFIEGDFAWEVKFYPDAKTTETVLATINSDTLTSKTVNNDQITTAIGTVHSTLGVVSIPLPLPSALTTLNQIYYSLAIDVDKNGLDAADVFADRFQITSVPFALSGQPTESFCTAVQDASAGNSTAYGTPNEVELYAFVTPAGGVHFNRMGLHIYKLSGTFSLGIYDMKGNLVASTGSVSQSPQLVDTQWETPVTETTLEPNKQYIAAWANNSGFGFSIGSVCFPATRTIGAIHDAAPNGLIPNKLDLTLLAHSTDLFPVMPPIQLLYVAP